MKALKSLMFCLILLLGVSSVVTAVPLSQLPTILYVKFGTNGTCTSWATACEFQTALSNAHPGDQIWVAAGTYKPTTTDPYPRDATFQLKTGVAIYGGFPVAGGAWGERNWETNLTTLSGDIGTLSNSTDNSYHVVTGNGVAATAVLDGFIITGGNANISNPHDSGGGMYNDLGSPTLTNVTFSGNSAYNGGGMVNISSSPTLTNVTFSTNPADYGGGMYNYNNSPTLTNVTFSNNTASTLGGGMYNSYSSPTLTNVTFSNNTASDHGGGMYNLSGSPTLTSVTFTGNSAYYFGGGMYNTNSSPKLTNVTFSANPATSGGGMFNDSSGPSLTNVTFSNNTASYDGGGMSNNSDSHPTLTNVTFSNNTASYDGGGMANWSSSSSMLTNAIVWGNTPDQIVNNGTGSVTYSDIQGGYPGTGNISADPLLDPLANNGGFTQTHAIGVGSPAIDAGDPAELNCPLTDQRGYPRPIDGDGNGSTVCDMGAYEFGSSADGFTLTVGIVGSGAVAKSSEQLKYPLGEVVSLTATANPGWTFSSWGGDASGTINPLPVTMSRHKSITANFTQDEYTLTVTPIGSGSVVVDPVKTHYHYGDLVTLTPTPTIGWTFSHWSGDATGTANPLTMNIQGNTTVTANFTSIYKIYLPLVIRN